MRQDSKCLPRAETHSRYRSYRVNLLADFR
jgi:hypothetical protein